MTPAPPGDTPTKHRPIRHGTTHAYNLCRLRPEGACDACKQAHADYVEDWRQRRKRCAPDAWRHHLDKEAARRSAHRALEHAHPAEYHRLYDEALDEITAARRAS